MTESELDRSPAFAAAGAADGSPACEGRRISTRACSSATPPARCRRADPARRAIRRRRRRGASSKRGSRGASAASRRIAFSADAPSTTTSSRCRPSTLEPRPDTETLVDLCRPPSSATRRRAAPAASPISAPAPAPSRSRCSRSIRGRRHRASTSRRARSDRRAQCRAARASRPGSIRSPADYAQRLDGRSTSSSPIPPYIPHGRDRAAVGEVRDFDPRLALDGGADGLDAYRRIAGDWRAIAASRRRCSRRNRSGSGKRRGRSVFDGRASALPHRHDDLGGIERALAFRRTV